MSRPDTPGTKNPEIVTRAAQTREAFGGTLAAGGGWPFIPTQGGDAGCVPAARAVSVCDPGLVSRARPCRSSRRAP